MANLIDKIYEKATKRKNFAVGSGFTAFRNLFLLPIELASGIPPEISANIRMFGTATNYFATGPMVEWTKNYLQKKVGIRSGSDKEAKIWFNRLYGASLASVEILASYLFYKYFGAKNIYQAGIPAVASVALTGFLGNPMFRVVETFKDGLDVGVNGGRSYFSSDTPKEKKKLIADIANIISLGGLAVYYWSTR
ncbi:hypothetical protein HYW75_06725 [Candidatus Pacearchaeota archaeon]|nr:hypothetical protein [Candidatus Pacearchaeota archaeon]